MKYISPWYLGDASKEGSSHDGSPEAVAMGEVSERDEKQTSPSTDEDQKSHTERLKEPEEETAEEIAKQVCVCM